MMDQGVELHRLLVHMLSDDHMAQPENTNLQLAVCSKEEL